MPGHLQSSGMPQTCHGDQVWAMGREWESRGGEGGFQPSKANTPPSQTHQISTPSYPAFIDSISISQTTSFIHSTPISWTTPFIGSIPILWMTSFIVMHPLPFVATIH